MDIEKDIEYENRIKNKNKGGKINVGFSIKNIKYSLAYGWCHTQTLRSQWHTMTFYYNISLHKI